MEIYCVQSCSPTCLHDLKPSEVFDEIMDPPRLYLTQQAAIQAVESECDEYINDPYFSDCVKKREDLSDGSIEFSITEEGEHVDAIQVFRISKVVA